MKTTKLKLNYLQYILIGSVVLLIVGALLYRNNAVRTQAQVTAIIAADKAGKPIDKLLRKLTAYTQLHMNTSTSFALQGSYLRDYSAAQAAALQQTQAGAKVYSDAQANCSAKVDSIQLSNCVTNYIAANSSPNQMATTTVTIDKTKYMHSLTAPAWSWDASGILITLGSLGLSGWAGIMLATVAKRNNKRYRR